MNEDEIRILVADDETKYVLAIQTYLEAKGYEVLTAEDGQRAVELVIAEEPDLVVLDVRMPRLNGYEACRRIRDFSAVPIIMLTALSEEADKIKGLDVGADDYVTKPFGAKELLARVRAQLRRAEISQDRKLPTAFQTKDVQVDFTQQRVFVRGQEVNLTPTEYRLLSELVKHAGRVLVLDYLVEKVWGTGHRAQKRLLRQAIHRLRQKVEADPKNPQYIQNRRGVGYVFQPEHGSTGARG